MMMCNHGGPAASETRSSAGWSDGLKARMVTSRGGWWSLAVVWLFGVVLVMGALSVQPAESSAQEHGVSSRAHGRRHTRASRPVYRYGWLRVLTNYEAQVTVDGQPYPKRSEWGMKLDANARHDVVIKLGDKEKSYIVVLGPREQRTLLIDLTGYNTPASPTPVTARPSSVASTPVAAEEKSEGEEESGKLTVYSKPRGEVYVDGASLGVSTPMINRDLEIGRHEVQVKWETGELSEVKTIRIRKGSKLKLFFRDRTSNAAGDK